MSKQPYNQRNNYRNNQKRPNNNQPPKKELKKGEETFPEDYVEQAELLCKVNRYKITNSQIRKLLDLVISLYNQENIRSEKEIKESTKNALNLVRMRMAYEAGRDREKNTSVYDFITSTRLMDYLKQINEDRQLFLDFTHYLESLVAFHKFYGGKE